MAISPPGDIVMDVARAADPAALEAARTALANRANGAAAPFSVDGAADASAPADTRKAATAETYRKFEAVVLQTFIQNMLPKDAGAVYGKGMAGDMWKSLLAQEIAGTMAARGGIGIADRMLPDHYVEGEDKLPLGPVSGGLDSRETDRQSLLSAALVQEFQTRLARSLAGTDEPQG